MSYAKRKVPIDRNRLKRVLKLNCMNIRKMCDALNLNYGTFLYCIEHGDIMPDILELVTVYLDTNMEYLQGL